MQQIERLRDPFINWYQLSPDKNPGVNVAQKQSTEITVLLQDSQVDSHYDSLGRMADYTYTARDIKNATHTYTSTYAGWEGYQEASVAGTSTDSNYRATTNTLTYDGFGRLTKQNEHTPLPDNYGTLEDRTRVYSISGMRQAQIDAAGNLGYRQQNLLQNTLWDKLAFKLWAGISDDLVRNPWAQQGPLKQMARPLSIFVGVPGATRNGFFLQPPALPNQNAAVESNRQQIAMKASGTMRNLVSQPQPLAQVMSYFARLTHPGNLYQAYADVARVDQWRGGH